MKRLATIAAGLGIILVSVSCSKQVTYDPITAKGDGPTLEQQTIPPGQMRASAEHLENGKRKWRVSDGKHALKEFQNSLKKNPYNFEAHYWLGIIERDNRRFEKSSYHFSHAVRYCPQGRWESRIRVDWGYVYELQGHKGMAAKQFDLALLADPKFREAQTARHRVLPLPTASFDKK